MPSSSRELRIVFTNRPTAFIQLGFLRVMQVIKEALGFSRTSDFLLSGATTWRSFVTLSSGPQPTDPPGFFLFQPAIATNLSTKYYKNFRLDNPFSSNFSRSLTWI
jgi:hypothetical protein